MRHFCNEEEKKLLEKIDSFQEMVPIAVGILARMNEQDTRPIHQVCGPISTGGKGSIQANMDYFNKAIVVAHENGYLVFDQTPFQDAMKRISEKYPPADYCTDILDVFYDGIFASGHVRTLLFLPAWETSRGATWERNVASKHRLQIEDFPEHLLKLLD